eukprot:COSAG04_NODE_3524_length_2740_cov_1.752367_2_plen_177_part_01
MGRVASTSAAQMGRPTRLLPLLPLLGLLLVGASSGSSTHDDAEEAECSPMGSPCSLNGECVASRGRRGVCVCRKGWRGPRCESLDLGVSRSSIHGENASWTWGGSPIVDEAGRHHLFFSYLTHGCGILHYQTNSIVRHAVAPGPAGPWRVLPGASLAPRPGCWDSGACGPLHTSHLA